MVLFLSRAVVTQKISQLSFYLSVKFWKGSTSLVCQKLLMPIETFWPKHLHMAYISLNLPAVQLYWVFLLTYPHFNSCSSGHTLTAIYFKLSLYLLLLRYNTTNPSKCNVIIPDVAVKHTKKRQFGQINVFVCHITVARKASHIISINHDHLLIVISMPITNFKDTILKAEVSTVSK